ncbi:MAG: dihydroneopterin aldolase [Paracoccaceae bacterium]|nr:dihydroneopterin aldolase [Paracoccaceae bacterium]
MDKIFVSNYIKEVEIGAFQSERDCTQRVEFNVCLEIEPLVKEVDDDVDKILSYDIIIEAINFELKSRRFNLLETLAERIAERCLIESRVIGVEIKIEKLDRIPGSLGVSISRVKGSERITKKRPIINMATQQFSLMSFSSFNNDFDLMKNWISALLKSNRPICMIIESELSFYDKLDSSVKNEVALLAMDQNAWLVSSLDKRLLVVSTKAELYSGLKSNKVILFCPSQFVKQSFSGLQISKYMLTGFSRWFAREMNLKNLYFVGPHHKKCKIEETGLNQMYLHSSDWNCFV